MRIRSSTLATSYNALLLYAVVAVLHPFWGDNTVLAFHHTASSSPSSHLSIRHIHQNAHRLSPGVHMNGRCPSSSQQHKRSMTSVFQKARQPQSVSTTRSFTRLQSSIFVEPGNSPVLGVLYMSLLALQYACQPLLTKKFCPKTMVKGTFVLVQGLVAVLVSGALLVMTKSWRTATAQWSFSEAWLAAGLPALLYAMQNYCSLQAYQNLAPITFNVLNQTKTLSAAVFCFVLLGLRQSLPQVGALILLLISGLVMESVIPLPSAFSFGRRKQNAKQDYKVEEEETEDASSTRIRNNQQREEEKRTRWMAGVVPVLLASLLSGLAGAFCQKNLQISQRNTLLYSMEIGLLGAIFNLANMLVPVTPDGRQIQEQKRLGNGITVGWTALTWIPIATNAVGGILVGLVIKYSGTVRKGFALILGMFLSGVLQNRFPEDGDGQSVTVSQWVGGLLAAISFTVYALFPPTAPTP